MCASVGINEITINNVNANYSYLSEEYILMEAALADALRPYGVKIGLSVRYVSPTNRQKAEGILRSYMDEALQRERVDMIFYLLTDIKAQQSKVLWAGEDADKYLRRAFDCQEADGGYILPGVISRKKQFHQFLLSRTSVLGTCCQHTERHLQGHRTDQVILIRLSLQFHSLLQKLYRTRRKSFPMRILHDGILKFLLLHPCCQIHGIGLYDSCHTFRGFLF